MSAIKKNIAKSSGKLPFYNQLGNHFLTFDKEQIVDAFVSIDEMFLIFLETEIASDFDLRNEMVFAIYQMKNLKDIINSFAPDQIKEESKILAANE